LFQGKKRFFAKLTGPPKIHYLNSIFSDAYYIHVVRDPRAVILSLLDVDFWKKSDGYLKPWWSNGLTENDIADWKLSGKSPIALASVQWRRVVEQTWNEKTLIPSENYLEIKYEDFVESPHEILDSVFARLHMRDSVSAHRYISSIGKLKNMNFKYKKILSIAEIAMIEKLTYETANQSGYRY
jgi:sulfotransferase family protein